MSHDYINKTLKKLKVSYKKIFKNREANEEERILLKRRLNNISYVDKNVFVLEYDKIDFKRNRELKFSK